MPRSGLTTTFVNIFYLSCNTVGLYTGMLIATFITWKRLRQSQNRVHNSRNNQRTHMRSVDRHLIKIMFLQVGISFILTMIRYVYKSYYYFTSNANRGPNITLRDSTLEELTITLYYVNFAKSFPVCTLTSPLFRQIFIRRLVKLCRLDRRFLNRVNPIGSTRAMTVF